jgi:hypothetical protein
LKGNLHAIIDSEQWNSEQIAIALSNMVKKNEKTNKQSAISEFPGGVDQGYHTRYAACQIIADI